MATLLWGGCLSCPQFFMFPRLQKSCCNKTGQCERNKSKPSPVKECKRVALELSGAAHPELDAVELIADRLRMSNPIDVKSVSAQVDSPDAELSPPDLNVLHSAFLI